MDKQSLNVGLRQVNLTAASSSQGHAAPNVTVSQAATKLSRTYKQTSVQANILGCCVLLVILGVCLLTPQHLASLFLLTSAIALPWRIVSFTRRKYTFFLMDFCYFANLATIAFLLLLPKDGWTAGGLDTTGAKSMGRWPEVVACMFVMTEGPLACAIFAWRCAWVLGSPDHTISVLIHLLPGLAITTIRHSTALLPASTPVPHNWVLIQAELQQWHPAQAAWWRGMVLLPLAFYLTWQALYFLVVQVACRDLIRAHGFDTSYNSLARRAAKSGGTAASRFVRRGSILRRVLAYGLLQLVFTLVAMVVGVATCHSYYAALLWQVVKFVLPLYWGMVDTLKAQAHARWE